MRREREARERRMMKSTFMLYTLCMKISDPQSRCYCVEQSEEDPRGSTDAARELTFFMDTDSGGTLAETAPHPYAAYIVLSSRGKTKVPRKKASDDVSYAGSAYAEKERERERERKSDVPHSSRDGSR